MTRSLEVRAQIAELLRPHLPPVSRSKILGQTVDVIMGITGSSELDEARAELAQVQAAALQALGRTVPQIGENPTLTVVNDLIIALRAERARNRATTSTTPRE